MQETGAPYVPLGLNHSSGMKPALSAGGQCLPPVNDTLLLNQQKSVHNEYGSERSTTAYD